MVSRKKQKSQSAKDAEVRRPQGPAGFLGLGGRAAGGATEGWAGV